MANNSTLQKRINREVSEILLKSPDVKMHGRVKDILLSMVFEDGHAHTHYPNDAVLLHMIKNMVEQKKIKIDGLLEQQKPLNIEALADVVAGKLGGATTKKYPDNYLKEKSIKKDRKIIFGHHRSLGDEIMFTAGVRDFKLLFPEITINVEGNHPELWINNPHIDPTLSKADDGVEFYRVGYPMVGNANNTSMHFSNMFLFDMIAITDLHSTLPMKLGEFCSAFANGAVGDPALGNTKKNPEAKEPFIALRERFKNLCHAPEGFVRQKGDLHLTDEEKKINLVKDLYGIEKYWVVAPGGKRDCTTKIWDWKRFEEVVKHFEGRIKFVTIGKSDLLYEPIKGTIDLCDKFNGDIRGLLSLIHNAEGCVSGPSALMHIAGALPKQIKGKLTGKPCVTILGGREPSTWIWYCNQQTLHCNGVWDCCSSGGCWTARTFPMQKDPKHNNNMCSHTCTYDGRTVQECMDNIGTKDVIRAIEKYFEGNLYTYSKSNKSEFINEPAVIKEEEWKKLENYSAPKEASIATVVTTKNKNKNKKEINLLGNLNTDGGGEQSFLMIADLLKKDGWKVNIHPWGSVHEKYAHITSAPFKALFDEDEKEGSIKEILMHETMVKGIPLLFYTNDCDRDFNKYGQKVVENSSGLIVGINYTIGGFKKNTWLPETKKLKAVVFQNREKKDEWVNQTMGFEDAKNIVLYGAIDIDKFYEVCPQQRKEGPLVVLKHCKADYRKYVTSMSKDKGEKRHIWQKHFGKETDIKFYERLLKDTKGKVRFEFMKAHSELSEAFKGNPAMVFHKWDAMSVEEFLARGHVYLYRTSNLWRDQYPRGIGEALAAGLPVLCEPRDGPADRVIHGDTGFHCVDYDMYLDGIKKFLRKEKLRHAMGMYAKDWAKVNLDPRKWVDIVNETFI